MNEPYLFEEIVVKKRVYNPAYGDKRICQCGHDYIDHFEDDNKAPMGCRKCECYVFMEKI
jgi:hypothetical protein